MACFCALRPSELFGLAWGCYTSNVFTIVNTAWRGRLLRKKIKRKNRYEGPSTAWSPSPKPSAMRLTCGLPDARTQCKRPHVPRNASACAKGTGDADSSGQLATPTPVSGREETRNGISSHLPGCSGGASPRTSRKKPTQPRCGPNSDIATFVPRWTSIRRLQIRKWPEW